MYIRNHDLFQHCTILDETINLWIHSGYHGEPGATLIHSLQHSTHFPSIKSHIKHVVWGYYYPAHYQCYHWLLITHFSRWTVILRCHDTSDRCGQESCDTNTLWWWRCTSYLGLGQWHHRGRGRRGYWQVMALIRLSTDSPNLSQFHFHCREKGLVHEFGDGDGSCIR